MEDASEGRFRDRDVWSDRFGRLEKLLERDDVVIVLVFESEWLVEGDDSFQRRNVRSGRPDPLEKRWPDDGSAGLAVVYTDG